MNKKPVIERVKREILENKLSVVLNEEEKVAIVVDKMELEDLIIALKKTIVSDTERRIRIKNFIDGMEELQRTAFP